MSEGENEPGDDDDTPVLSPDELDISDNQRVVELEEGRYVISSDEGRPSGPIEREIGPPTADDSPDEGGADREPSSAGDDPAGDVAVDDVHQWLEAQVADAGSRYGFDITATFEGTVDRRELFSNDVVTTFESLLVWYAHHVGEDTSVEEVLGILLTEADAGVKYPARTIEALADRYGLSPEDSIADLVEATGRGDGFVFPP